MRKVMLEIAGRWYSRLNPEPWRWHRQSTIIAVEIPGPGHATRWHIPAPIYSFNVSVEWSIDLQNRDGKIWLGLFDAYGYMPVRNAEWRETGLWSQVTFDPYQGIPTDQREDWCRGGWWFRWRTLGDSTPDILGRVMDLVTAGTPAEQIQREITAYGLGMPIYRETV